jgi:hypothetical protein
MPGRLSRCFTGRWNENRFREAKVNRVAAVWRLQETGGGSGSLGGEIPIQRPGTTKCLTRESVTTPSGALCCGRKKAKLARLAELAVLVRRGGRAREAADDRELAYCVAGVTPTIPQLTLVRPVTAAPISRSPNSSVVPGLTAAPVWSVRSTCFCA